MFQSEAFFFGIHNLQIVSFLIGWTDFFVANLFSILFECFFNFSKEVIESFYSCDRSKWNFFKMK